MQSYLRKVLLRLVDQLSNFEYNQGLHWLVKAMYESQLNQE